MTGFFYDNYYVTPLHSLYTDLVIVNTVDTMFRSFETLVTG